MKEYMMIFRNEKNDTAPQPTEAQMQAVMGDWQRWIKEVANNGRFSGTNRLYPEGKTLKPGNVITDGPYAEVKEIVGGYLVVKANSLDEAVELAKACPNLTYGGNVEVRAVMSIDNEPASVTFLNEQKN